MRRGLRRVVLIRLQPIPTVGLRSEDWVLTATGQVKSRGPWGGAQVALVMVCALLGGIAGFVFYTLQTPVYESEASVLVLPTAGGLDSSIGGGGASEVQIQTEAEVAHSAQVAADAAAALDGRLTAQELIDSAAVTTSPNSQVLVVTFEAKTPELARDGAQALATAYLDRRSNSASTIRDDAKAGLDKQLTSLNDELDGYTGDLAKAKAGLPGTEAALARAEAKIAITQSQISDINSRLVALDVQTTDGGQVISVATLPASPTSPVLWIDVAAGIVLGGLIGSGIVLLLDRRAGRSEQAATGSSALASLSSEATPTRAPDASTPSTPSSAGGAFVTNAPPRATVSSVPALAAAAEQAASQPPDSASAEFDPVTPTRLDVLGSVGVDESGGVVDADRAGLHALVTAIAAGSQRRGPLVLVGVDYPGLMTRAAVAISDAVNEVLGGAALVLTETGAPVIAERFTADAIGLSNVLEGECAAVDALTPASSQWAALMAPGTGLADIPPATQRRRLGKVWTELSNSHGTAVAQVQVPLDGALAQSVLQTAGPVLIVVKVGLSQQQDLVYAVEQLSWLGVTEHVVGIVTVSDLGGLGSQGSESLGSESLGLESLGLESLGAESLGLESLGSKSQEDKRPMAHGSTKSRASAKVTSSNGTPDAGLDASPDSSDSPTVRSGDRGQA